MIGKGLTTIKNSPNLNVLNILRALIEDDNCEVYIPLGYAKERYAEYQENIIFNPIEAGVTMKVHSLSSHQERMNFSIGGTIQVYVEHVDECGNIEYLSDTVYRTYNVIRDGELNMSYVIARVSEDGFKLLAKSGVLYMNEIQMTENHKYLPNFLYKVNLTNIPLVSYAWAQPQQCAFIESLKRESILANTLKKVNQIIKENDYSKNNSSFYSTKNSYALEVEAQCVVYGLTKSIDDVDEELIAQCVDAESTYHIKNMINSELKSVRLKNRVITFAMEKHSHIAWGDVVTKPRSNKQYQYALVENVEIERIEYTKKFK